MVAGVGSAGSPPAAGWMDVYSLVFVEGYSVPDAAAKLNLPAEKVRQARNQVITWLATNRPLLSERPKEEALQLSEALAREQLEHLYAEAMEAWKNSQQEEVATRQEGIMARTTRTIKSSNGKVCYLNMAAKISDMLLKIPLRYVPAWMEEGSEANAPIRFELDAGERAERAAQQTSREEEEGNAAGRDSRGDVRGGVRGDRRRANPPLEDCSDFLQAAYGEPNPLEQSFDTMRYMAESNAESRERFQRNSLAGARLFSPVQMLAEGEPEGDAEGEHEGDEEAFEDAADHAFDAPVRLEEARPSLLPKQNRRPLTRKERRARQKLLEKAKKRSSAG